MWFRLLPQPGRCTVRNRRVYWHYDLEEQQRKETYVTCPFCQTRLVDAESGQKLRRTCPKCGFVHYENPAPTVSILIADGDQVLLGKRMGHPGKGTWAIPSGYVEYEDDFLSAAVREAKEETNLDVEIRSIINVVSSFVSPWFHFLGIYVSATVVDGTAQAGDDLEEVGWFPITGPLPEMGFQEDVDAIHLFAQQGHIGLPIDAGGEDQDSRAEG